MDPAGGSDAEQRARHNVNVMPQVDCEMRPVQQHNEQSKSPLYDKQIRMMQSMLEEQKIKKQRLSLARQKQELEKNGRKIEFDFVNIDEFDAM